MTTPAFGTFFLPGPTEVHAEVLAGMLRPMMPHRGAAFEQLFARCVSGLQTVFRTTRPVYVSSSSATGLMEGAVRAARPGPILALVNGAFSERFARIASACGRETEVLQAPLGASFELDAVRARLAARTWAAMTVVHSETSTGVLTDVRALTALAHEHGVPCLVDSVTGIGGTPVETDAWALDFVLTGSQKALALPPGLAFGVASEGFIAHAKEGAARGVYFDLVEFESYGAKHQTPNTPAVSLLYALDAQLPRIAAEGIEGRWARHAAMAGATHAWVAQLATRTGRAFGILAPPGQRSHTVTAITVPDGVEAGAIVKAVAKRGYVIGDGYGTLKSRTFRIGHMGDHTLTTLAGCLAVCDEAIDEVLTARA
jgi:aspartate aminotransferase-like enzyme